MNTGSSATRRRRGRLDAAFTALGALLAAALIVTLALGGFTLSDRAGTGSGAPAEQARPLPPFTGIVLAGANNVVVRVGGRESVVVHADRNLLGRVTTRVRSGTLVIGTTPGELEAKSPMYVALTVPTLDELGLEGAGNIDATGIDARSLTVRLPGAGNIAVTGTATTLQVTIGGEGTADLRGLVARDAKAELSGTGTITLTATRRLDAGISGSGTILYGGDPAHVSRNITGSGTISAG
jgi:Putative auto-transporter adhesin, head GIN domain